MKGFVQTCLVLVCWLSAAWGADTAVVRGVIHDPQHRPIAHAQIVVQGAGGWSKTLVSDDNGQFEADGVPAGGYRVAVTAAGFRTLELPGVAAAGNGPVLHLQMELKAVNETVEVSGAASKLGTQTSTVETFVSPKEIVETAGADQTNSLAMITDFTPGAYMVHDMLHMRGGHQVNWFFDDIPVVNTNIAANVAPLINPKNVEELQMQRGGYSSEYGDRTYGFFNVITPSGFEKDREANLVVSGGNFYASDDQINFGGHTARLGYYASFDANRSQLGLSTPVSQVIHDQQSGFGGFASLLYNPNGKDQLRWIASLRGDHYQIPNGPDDQAAGIRDVDLERDDLVGMHWTHVFGDGVTFGLSPYYHYNNAHFLGGAQDMPIVLNDNIRSNYVGLRAVLQVEKKVHNARFGIEGWGQHDNDFFGLSANPGGAVLSQQQSHWATSNAVFAEDQYKATRWLTLDLGFRFTHYSGLVSENAADPRVGASIRIPKLKWIVRGYYAYYYQPPPLNSLAGPSLDFAVTQGYGFIPLRGERDIQHDFGITIPVAGWSLDVDNFHTSARNFLDHDVIGNSGIFVPLTDLGARVTGTEVSLRSPRLFHHGQVRVAYANQAAQGISPVTGGLLQNTPPATFPLDHDQRHTLSAVLSLSLPGEAWMTPAYQFGSGFLNGDGPAHLPPHSTFDLSVGKHLSENLTIAANAVNVGNSRYLVDTSNTFGGTHYINPRQIYGEVRYRFHF